MHLGLHPLAAEARPARRRARGSPSGGAGLDARPGHGQREAHVDELHLAVLVPVAVAALVLGLEVLDELGPGSGSASPSIVSSNAWPR